MKEKNKLLKQQLESNFVFLSEAEKLIKKYYEDNSAYDKSFFTCFKGYIENSKNYLFSVYEDISRSDTSSQIFAKSNANRALIRNCLEATILLYIFSHHPEYCDKYYETYESDLKRIGNLFLNVKDEEKYLKRFAWLPRVKGKRINNLNDLLNYVEFDDENQKLFYQILIRNFDTFVHPSFNFSLSLENKNLLDHTLIYTLYAKDGIIYQLHECFLSSFIDYFEGKIQEDEVEHLHSILSTIQITNNMDLQSLRKMKQYPFEINSISYVIALLPSFLLPNSENSWKRKNIGYLLQDLCTHLDDLLKSYFTKNVSLFYIEARYVFESLSILHILLQEDEKRNYIFHIHQDIKGYESKNTTYTMIGSDEFLERKEQLKDVYENNIQEIEKYYVEEFNQEIERNKILRLNGWSLFLKNQQNDYIPNAPDFIKFLIQDHLHDEEKVNFVLGMFEESNAFLHITPYATFTPTFDRAKEAISIIITSLSNIIFGVLKVFKLNEVLDPKTANVINEGFFKASQSLYKYINSSNKKS